jgi:DNA-binding MarR family transcriptional regulator
MFDPSKALEATQLIDRLERLARGDEQSGGLNPAQWEALRYLARANRFSRTPAALADYLGSTRGTISRTLASLEMKGFVQRKANLRDGRSVAFALTQKGDEILLQDPLLVFARDLDAALSGKIGDLIEGLRAALRKAIARNKGHAFGVCSSCRHFCASVRLASALPHHCALLDEPLSEADSRAICLEQVPRAA